ncbi:spore germination lipoprotein GerD [Pseudalkalibacillus caeni]|uniref:Spore gernimation protein GerD n=1 Tax=Exobacillus caeni TaxID=2574798 RepID=A0A5R9EYA4_9BACL|nr:spore germination lipoprotein GerD [Pseudalkalibacillus caeni]TLS35479.1 spore gernimation protein GerD [Pseudalkalibacillus caeni]
MYQYFRLLICCILFLSVTACAAGAAENAQPDYEETKKMMVDMLKTDDGKKAIHEIMTDDKIKQDLVMEQSFVKESIQKTLTTEEGKKYWQEIMKDPKFVKEYAKSLQSEHEALMKGLMNDPEYQEKLMDILQDPEMEKRYLQLLESKAFREQMKTTVTEIFESPLFMAKVQEMVANTTAEQLKKAEKQGGDKKKDEEGQGGGSDQGQEG